MPAGLSFATAGIFRGKKSDILEGFHVISEGDIYIIDGFHCLECGRCGEVCPEDATEPAEGI
jgi:ferredoxin